MSSLFHRHGHVLDWHHHPHADPRNAANHVGYQPLPTQAPGKDIRCSDANGANGANDIANSEKVEEALKKAEMKASVFDTYAVCAALLASFSCSASFVQQDVLANLDLWPTRVCIAIQQILIRFCIIGAIHAMLVFMFSALYCKTALARGTYSLQVYDRFNTETGGVRQKAFWSMYYTAIAYCCQASLSTFQTFRWEIALVITVIILVIIGKLVWDAQRIIKSAGIIFLPDDKLKTMFEDVLDVDAGVMTDASDDEASRRDSVLSKV